MRTLGRMLLITGGVALAGLWPAAAEAQKDTQPRLPNVLLLIDNSGSMEYLQDYPNKLPGDVANSACNGVDHPTVRTAWANLVMALTGNIADTDFQCLAVNRKSSTFKTEYTVGTLDPYDYGYYLPFHRMYSGGCGFGAGDYPGGTWKWWKLPSAAGGKDFSYHTLSSGAESAPTQTKCTFNQAADGALDEFRGLVRFGMMTLDTFPDAGTGSTHVGATAADTASEVYSTARTGMWSYFRNWTAGEPASPTFSVGANGVNTARPAAGYPSGCNTGRFWEVGARSAAAPPWEGRLVGFGDWTSDTDVITTTAQIEQELRTLRPFGSSPIAGILDDAREFLFNDPTRASTDTYQLGPSDDQYWINGCRKTYVILFSDGLANMDLRAYPRRCIAGHCEGTSIGCSGDAECTVSGCDSAPIAPVAGQPAIAGMCPYDPPDAIAKAMYEQAPTSAQSVKTYVIGLTQHDFQKIDPTLQLAGKTDCAQLQVGPNGSDCVNPPASLAACCNLQKIAAAGGTTNARFVATRQELQQEISKVLSEVIGTSGKTDRTWPVFAAVDSKVSQGWRNDSLPTASYKFAASFKPTVNSATNSIALPGTWSGILQRERTSCPATSQPTVQTLNSDKGDDYAYNVDSADGTHKRKFFTAVGPIEATDNKNHHHGSIDSQRTLRPFYNGTGVGDGLGSKKPQTNQSPTEDTLFVSAMSSGDNPLALGMPLNSLCNDYFGDSGAQATVNQNCAKHILNWFVGITNNDLAADKIAYTRHWADCPKGASSIGTKCSSPLDCPCSKFGAIYHSTPVVVGPPREFLRDDSYVNYSTTTAVKSQPTMLYTATLDGQLHAFKVQSNNSGDTDPLDNTHKNNEIWSFLPPAVLPAIVGSYNKGGAKLLDGMPVIADVPGTLYTSAQDPNLARIGSAATGWHRILLASGGAAGGFYYALDITDPANPRFLWQLMTDDTGYNLFGSTTPTPAIALVNLKINSVVQQVAIAILPGGGTGAVLKDCDKQQAHLKNNIQSPWDLRCGSHAAEHTNTCSNILLNDPSNAHLQSGVTGSPPPLTCWDMKSNDSRSTGNSIVIARLDTGEVLGYFLGEKYRGGPLQKGDGHDDDDHGKHKDKGGNLLVQDSPFTSPITGVPVPYPGLTGQVSDRFYVGDADGLVWRVDMSDPDINNWAVELAWDSYVTAPAGVTSYIREGISVPPIVTRDEIGNPVLLIATGDQDSLTSQPSENHIWSITEMPLTRDTSPNWHIRLPGNGPRVTGPMALFNGALYFSTFQAWAVGSSAVYCSDGFATVWGVDYLRRSTVGGTSGAPAGLTAVQGQWPVARFPGPAQGGLPPVWGQDGGPGSIIMGVSVGQTPTCDSTSTVNDAYGSHLGLTSTGASAYQVMWQTGTGAGLSGNPNVSTSPNIANMQSISAPQPGQGTRIDSWASIIE